MSFDYTNTQNDYLVDRYNSILKVEEVGGVAKLEPYNDGAGWVTIGAGYNLSDANVRSKVLDAMNITNPEVRAALDAYLGVNQGAKSASLIQSELNAILGEGATFGFDSEDQVKEVFDGTDGLAQDYESLVDLWAAKYGLGTIPPSRERIALLSLAWNSQDKNKDGIPDLLGEGLGTAMAQGNRAEAWFEIRYNSNGGDLTLRDGTAKRRYYESSIFGLYDNSANVGIDEAKSIYRMLQLHRDKITDYEILYGVQVGKANFDYNLTGTDYEVNSLIKSFDPAKEAIVADLNATNPGINLYGLDYLSTDVFVDPTTERSIVQIKDNPLTGSDRNDIMLGEDGNDELHGGAGDDVLVGGTGEDQLYGEAGADLMIGGDGVDTYHISGNDIIIDSGRNFIVYDNQILAGGFVQDGTTSTYRSMSNSNYTLTFNSPGHMVLNDTDSVTFQNQTSAADFENGDFGINLYDSIDPTRVLTGTDGDDYAGAMIFPSEARYYFTGTISGILPANDYVIGMDEFSMIGDTPPDLEINGGAGNDQLIGLAGSDYIRGGSGNDLINGEFEWTAENPEDEALLNPWGDTGKADILMGETGNDVIFGGNGDDLISGGDDNDFLAGGLDNDIVSGDDGNDVVTGSVGDDMLMGGSGNDLLYGDGYLNMGWMSPADIASFDFQLTSGDKGYTTSVNLINFDVGFDVPESGADTLYGGSGNDLLSGGGGDDILMGEADHDTLLGGSGNDYLDGGTGNDWLMGDEGGDVAGNDILLGGAGDDDLYGQGGDDALYGGDGLDFLLGGDGNDILSGGAGNDKLDGGIGDDRYEFSLGDGYDVVDYNLGANRVSLGDGISPEDLYVRRALYDATTGQIIFSQAGSDLWLEYGPSDGVLLRNGAGDINFTYEFDGGILLSHAQLQALSPDDFSLVSPPVGDLPPVSIPPTDPFVPLPEERVSCPDSGPIDTSVRIPLGTTSMPLAASDFSEAELMSFFRNYNTLGSRYVKFTMADGYEVTSLSLAGGAFGSSVYSDNVCGPNSSLSTLFTAAQRFFPRRDPLTFDLDGDGIETVPPDLENPILFDHTGEGIKTGTGWIAPDDGFLTLDRDGNGTIDNGRELFGDSTPIFDAGGNEIGLAEDGFDALAQEDTNADGVVNAEDARWANLRIWQDLNQDAISQEGELKSLDELGIAGINVAKTEYSQILPGGNEIADLGTYIRTDGSTGTAGTTSDLADVNLAADTFNRVFADEIPLTADAEILPDMQGSGVVRDLREAASLSPELADLLGQYAQASTRAEQLAIIDSLIVAWGATSDMADMATKAAENGYNFVSNLSESQQAMVAALEQFNGRNFYRLPWEEENGVSGITGMTIGDNEEGEPTVWVTMTSAHLGLLSQGWNVLHQSIYDNLLLQTRLKPYMEGIGFAEGENGIELDLSGTANALQARFGAAPAEAVRDLLDLQRMVGTDMNGLGWDGYRQLQGWLADASMSSDPALVPSLVAALADFGYAGLETEGDGNSGTEVVIGDAAGDVLNGQGGNDLVLGSNGDDILNGGTGTDVLAGGAGNDTYIFNLGDGADTIVEAQGDTGVDTLQFGEGVLAGDLDIYVDGDKLVFRNINGSDRLSIQNWFGSLSNEAHRLDTLNFSDDKSLDLHWLHIGGEEADTLTGSTANDILLGGDGDDILSGEAGDDLLYGDTGNDIMVGGTGNDTYVVDSLGDTVVEAAGEGVDTVESRVNHSLADNVENLILAGVSSISGVGNELDNIITGNRGSNSLSGMDGDDSLSGGAGYDYLDGGTGADTMVGGTGDDTYVVDNNGDLVSENIGEGTDTVRSSIDYTLTANVENLTLTGSETLTGIGNELNNELIGNDADNTLIGHTGNDSLDGGVGADSMLGGIGNDTYVVDNNGDEVIENADQGTDTAESLITYTLTDNVENLTLLGADAINGTGNELDNIIIGNIADNTLTGLTGNDFLNGEAGADTMLGGTGDDSYVVDNVGDVVMEIAGEGADTVLSSIDYQLGDNVENLILTGWADIDGTGNELDNTLLGNYSDNVLDGGLGADNMAGRSGDDTYILDNSGDSVTEYGGQGTDTVVSPFDYTLGDNVENLTLTGEALTGTGNALNNVIIGTAADNTLTGLDGNDTLDGGAGGDTLIGGLGDDTYVVDSLADTTTEGVNEGVDTVQADLTWTLADNLDNLTLTGSEAIDGTGNELNNVITGNSAANILTGLGGNDTLDGGAEADTMQGGTGDDTYVVDNSGDAVIEGVGEGTDTVQSSITYTLTDNVENLTLTGTDAIDGTGNELDNVITGNRTANTLTGLAGNDLLDGSYGADTMAGGTGDDTYIVDNTADIVLEGLDEGVDHVQASASHTLTNNVENLTLTGYGNISGIGNALDNTIIGNSGANLIDGGIGADAMAGNGGNDTYVVDDIGDRVTENANEGTDTVRSSIDYTLTDNVENLELTGSDNINATGNTLANTLSGNSGDNVLSGQEGNDTLIGNEGNDVLDGGLDADAMAGGLGDDTYVVDNIGDEVTELEAEGVDTVQSSIDYTLADTLENLELTGAADINGTGNILDNAITGNSGANLIDGAAGADTMAGGAGDDIYFVDNAADVVVELADEGIDTVEAVISQTLADNVDNLILTGMENLDGTGNILDNTLIGNDGDNVLDGGAGIDTMIGGLGDDTYVVDESADVVVESSGEGVDTVFASADYTLADNVEHLTLTGDADLAGTGNVLDNTLTGNSGVNLLSGGAGNDTYIVDNSADAVVENVSEGTDTVFASADYTLSDNIENLTLTGTADIDGTGNNLNNTILGNSGANVIDGSAGADNMTGGTGDDTYIVDNTGDLVTESVTAGIDLVESSISYTLGDNVENLTLTGTAAINGSGNTLNNIILGNTADNQLSGLSGNDTLLGGAGSDYLDGGYGADAMSGGSDNDTYIVDNTGDLVIEIAGEGVDTVQSSISYTLTNNVENLTLTGSAALSGSGNELDNVIIGNISNNILSGLAGNDTLIGNAGYDTLDGGSGADSMSGGTGNDTYVVDDGGDLVSEAYNSGIDLVRSSIDYTLTDNVENLTLTGTTDINGIGNNLNNVITGNEGSNVLDGLAGNDTLYGNAGDDTLSGGDGADRLYGGDSADQLFGNAGIDILDGGIGADTMAGGTDNDTYVVDNGGDLVIENVNEGTDLVQSSITYTLTDNVENLTQTGTAAIDGTGNELANVIRGNSGANVLDGLAGNDTIYGNAGDDTLLGGEGSDYLDGGYGADAMAGGSDNDTYIVDNIGDLVIEIAEEGVDTVQSSISYTLTDNVENLTLTGYGYINGTGNELDNVITGNIRNNILSGLAGNDTLIGNAGDDTLDGGSGADTMSGGTGNDTYVVDDAGDLVSEAYNSGIDLVRSSIDYTLTDNVENLTLTGTTDINGAGNNLNNVITGNEGSNVLDGLAGNDTLYGNAGDDTLSGGDGDDSLSGGDGADQLFGNAGTDILDGGTGADTMAGGTDNDTYVVDNGGDLVIENVNEGTDLVQSSITYTLTDNVENLTQTGTAAIDGTGNELANVIIGNSGANVLDGLAGNDTIYGNAGDDTLLGGEGSDYLDGGYGADAMAGGSDNDTYIVDNTGDLVIETGGEGVDTVQSSISYTLTDNVENLTLTGSAALSGTGNELGNVITGNFSNSILSGLAGNDTLLGNAGDDTLDGGSGADTMSGGTGNDTYVVDDGGDLVSEAYNSGIDLVRSSIDYTLTDNVENLTLTGTTDINGTGNNLNNVITGNEGSNVLDGGTGVDTLIGGSGDDTYMIDNAADAIVELFDGGIDTVHSNVSYALSDNIETLYLTGTTDINGTGNVGDNLIVGNNGNNTLSGEGGNDTIYGGEGNDILNGGDGVDLLFGESGNDLLNGGIGSDVMTGGIGDDTYVVDDAADVVVESAGEGVDTVLASIDYVLADNVENLVLTGVAAINGTGDEYDNMLTGNNGDNILSGLAGDDTLIGNDGNDTLIGGAGNDLMQGGSGNDTYIVENTGDVVVEEANAGIDTVQTNINYTLTDNVENLTLTGTADLNGIGNNLDNVITGNEGMNVLDGGTGADTLSGGDGDDTYIIDNTGDTVVEATGQGTDTVLASVNHTLDANVENLVLTGADAISGTGNDLDNMITGNSASNTLDGQGGNDLLDGGMGGDTMAGGSGDDTYIIDDANDTVVEIIGNGTDTVLASVSHTLDANVENLNLTGLNNSNGTGNDIANIIIGNSGDNVLAGGGGDDLLHGGSGNDILQGEAGDDRYVFLLGDGNDRIVDAQGYNTLYVGSGLSEFDLRADRVGDDMVVQVLGTTDTFVLADWFTQVGEGLNSMEFDDGTVLDRTGIDMLQNRPPVAHPDQITVYEDGGPLAFSTSLLLANDTDPNPWDVLTVTAVGTSGVDASVSLVNGEVIYDIGTGFQSLAKGEVLQDSFTYTVSDMKGETDEGIVLVDIVGVNDIPVVQDNAPVALNGVLTASGTVDAFDVDGDVLAYLVDNAPQHGSLTVDALGNWLYTAEDGYYGTDQATILVADGNGGTVSSALDFKVNVYEQGDWVIAADGPDALKLQDISKSDLQLTRSADDLVVTINERGSITVSDYFNAPENGVKVLDTMEGPLALGKDVITTMEPSLFSWFYSSYSGASALQNLIYGTDDYNDSIYGGNLADVLFGAAGNDTLVGNDGNDTLLGGIGNDSLKGNDGDDSLYGDSGNDSLLGGTGNDALIGGLGDDNLSGESGNDWLWGNAGQDLLYGNDGNDILAGGQGDDLLKGGGNDDLYLMNRGDGSDLVQDNLYTGFFNLFHEDAGHDTIGFGEGIGTGDIAFYMESGDLQVQYGDSDLFKVLNQDDSRDKIELFELADGSYLTDADINQLIQDMASYAVNEGIALNSVSDVRQNAELMTMITTAWHQAA